MHRRKIVRALVRKELHLQRSNFMFMAGVVMFWLVLRVLSFAPDTQIAGFHLSELIAAVHIMAVLTSLVILLPLMFGATAIAGERQLGVLDWQLALPVSRTKQLLVKAGVAVALAIFTGGILALVLDLLLPPSAHALLSQYRGTWPAWYSALLSCIGMLASALMRDAYRALLCAAALVAAMLGAMRVPDVNGIVWPHTLGGFTENLTNIVALVERLAIMAAAALLLARYYFRPRPDRRAMLLAQVPLWLLVCLFTTHWGVYAERAVPLQQSFWRGPERVPVPAVDVSMHWDDRITSAEMHLGVTWPTAVVKNNGSYFETLGRRWAEAQDRETVGLFTQIAALESARTGPSRYIMDDVVWRSPAGKFVASLKCRDYQRVDCLIDAGIDTCIVREFPEAVGELMGFFGPDGYSLAEYDNIKNKWGAWTQAGSSRFPRRIASTDFPKPIKASSQAGSNDATVAIESFLEPHDASITWRNAHFRWTETREMLGRSNKLLVCAADMQHNTPNATRQFSWSDYLLYVDPTTSTAISLDQLQHFQPYPYSLDRFLAADDRALWYARGATLDYEGRSLSSFSVVQINATGARTGREYTVLKKDSIISASGTGQELYDALSSGRLTSCTVCMLSGQFGFYAHLNLRPALVGNKWHSILHVSPDERYLGYILVTVGGVTKAGHIERVQDLWYEIHAFDLTNGIDHVLGGFPAADRPRVGEYPVPASCALDPHGNAQPSAVYLSWSADNRLAVLYSDTLFMFDPTVQPRAGELAPRFQKYNLEFCSPQDLEWWDKNTLVLWGSQSIWKFEVRDLRRIAPDKASRVAMLQK